MNVLLQSPNTSKIITLPSLTGASPSDIHRYMECHPPTFPSDNSWDILYPVPESSIATFTRPPLAERSNLRKAALVQTRKKLERETRFEERFKLLEEKIHKIEAVKLSQQALLQRELDRHTHVLRFETYTRLLQVLNDDLMSNLDAEVKSQMKKINLDYITSILEGVYPHGTLESSPRDQLLHLATTLTTGAGQPILPAFPDQTKRMKLSHGALNTMSEEHVRLAVQLYHVIHGLRDGDSKLFKTTRNGLQHPRPSIHVAVLALAALVDEVPFNFDLGTANILIEQEVMKDTGDPQSSLFGQTDDPVRAELLKHIDTLVPRRCRSDLGQKRKRPAKHAEDMDNIDADEWDGIPDETEDEEDYDTRPTKRVTCSHATLTGLSGTDIGPEDN